jgi:hypothetical protein
MKMKQKENLKKLINIILLGLIGGIIGYFIGKMLSGETIHKSTVSPILPLILLIPIIIFVIGWHEIGHAIVGVKVGFDFRMFVVGPFLWEKQNSTWRFTWNKDINKAGGLVLCLPTDTVRLSRRFLLFAAGGPLASLILSLICLLIYWGFLKNYPISPYGVQIANISLLLIGATSFMIFIATSIPSKMGGFYSDGARVLRLIRGGDTAKFEILMMSIIANTSGGIRPKLLNMNQIEEMDEIAIRLNEPFRVYIHSFFHHVAFDKGDFEKAEKHLLDYINVAHEIPEGIRNAVWLDATFFYAFAKKDLVGAEKYWHKFKPSPIIPKAQILATEAVLYFLKNDNETAKSKLNVSLSEIPNMIDKGLGIALKDRIIHLQNEILAK